MNDQLKHYGVLGMRWGVRRRSALAIRTSGKLRSIGSAAKSLSSRLSSKIKNSRDKKEALKSEDHKKTSQLKKKKLSQMSNDELRILTQRMQLERQYRDLKNSNTSAGKKWVSDVVKESGKDVAKQYVTKALGDSVKFLLENFFPKK